MTSRSRSRCTGLEKIYRYSNNIANSRQHILLMLFIEQNRGTVLDKARTSRIEKLRVRLNKLSLKRHEEIVKIYSNKSLNRNPSPVSQGHRRRSKSRKKQRAVSAHPGGPIMRIREITPDSSESTSPVRSRSTSPEPILPPRTPSPTPQLKVKGVDIQPDKTVVDMVPHVDKPSPKKVHIDPEEHKTDSDSTESEDDEDEDKDIVYPDDVLDFHPYKVVARYRRAINESTNFCKRPIVVAENSVETLILGLEEFAQQHGCDLSFSVADQRFNKSIYRATLGTADLGSIHLLATDSIKTANFQFEIDLDYDEEITQSTENVERFVVDFCKAISDVLSCDNNSVRVFSIDKLSKKSGKSHVNFGLTTPDPKKTERLARDLQNRARSGFRSGTILEQVKKGEYEITWKPVISHLKIRPNDLNPLYNLDYRPSYIPTEDTRGNCPYYLPIGWYRFGLNVDNKFEDNMIWLGCTNAQGEWPVAFHGTCAEAVTGIVRDGLLPSAVKTDAMMQEAIEQIGEEANNPGLYVATHCNGGSDLYTRPFTVTTSPRKSEQFRIVFQCRVQPGKFTTHKSPVNVGEAWRIVDPKAVRPYGILLKKETSSSSPQ